MTALQKRETARYLNKVKHKYMAQYGTDYFDYTDTLDEAEFDEYLEFEFENLQLCSTTFLELSLDKSLSLSAKIEKYPKFFLD